MMEVNIIGRTVSLQLRGKSELKGINVGEMLSYNFYDGVYLGISMLFVQPKRTQPTPRECSIVSGRLTRIFSLPVVFILESRPSYERQRLIDKGVYFVMGNKFAMLPMLIANERIRQSKPAKRLTPVAQYTLLYHLIVQSIEGKSARDLSSKLPYSYASITLGLTCLEDLGLCKKIQNGEKWKTIHFEHKGRELWDMAQDFLIGPVEKRIYCDVLTSDVPFANCSINALSHYSWLNPDKTRMIAMTRSQFQNLSKQKALNNANEFDGNIMIEVWKYPPVAAIENKIEWVDKLSLVLSLRKDNDPRVEGEVERVINEVEWKD